MKKSYILTSLALASVGFFAFQHVTTETSVVEKFQKEHLFSGGGQSGLTGAPGEANCTQCHQGSVNDGTTINSFALLDGTTPVTSYVPGTTYTATLQISGAGSKAGFSSTTLDGSDNMAGLLVGAAIGGTQNFSAGGRDYVSHTSTSVSASSGQFAWSWAAPATDVGTVTFYIASNVANDDGGTTGDMIYVSTHTIGSTASLDEEVHDPKFVAGYNAATNKLVVDFNSLAIGEMHLNLVDMNGRSVFNTNLGQSEIGENNETLVLPSELSEGMYVVHFFVGNKAMSANILVKK
jgi:hypothetical protein